MPCFELGETVEQEYWIQRTGWMWELLFFMWWDSCSRKKTCKGFFPAGLQREFCLQKVSIGKSMLSTVESKFCYTVVTPNKGTPNKGIFPYLTRNRQNGK